MTPDQANILLEALTESLAAIEHERWAHWQRYVHASGVRQADGSLLIPGDLVGRWDHQILANYNELTEAEKESDREQVRKYLPVIAKALSRE